MGEARGARFGVRRAVCLRCGACATLAPEVFQVELAGARVTRQPEHADEARRAEAAQLNCPTGAITLEPSEERP